MTAERGARAARCGARGRRGGRGRAACTLRPARQRGVRTKSGPTDLVSDADLAAESAIRSVLAPRRPGDAILGEEGGATGDGELRWVVDPLDGTINYLYGIPAFAVSVACEDASGDARRRRPRSDPRGALRRRRGRASRRSTASRSARDGARRIARRRRWSPPASATTRRCEPARPTLCARVLPRVRDIRRVGAAALDLCWCACGRVRRLLRARAQPLGCRRRKPDRIAAPGSRSGISRQRRGTPPGRWRRRRRSSTSSSS